MFAEYGRVVEVRINRKSGRIDVPNFGFVVFAEPSSVGKALDRRVRAATELQRRAAAYSRALPTSRISLARSYEFMWLLLLLLDHAAACIM